MDLLISATRGQVLGKYGPQHSGGISELSLNFQDLQMSLLDDYHQHVTSTNNSSSIFSAPEIVASRPNATYYGATSMYPSTTEQPIFSLEKVQFSCPGKIMQMAIENNIILLAIKMTSGSDAGATSKTTSNTIDEKVVLLKIDLEKPQVIEEISKCPPELINLSKMFLDYSGRHLFLATKNQETFYVFLGVEKQYKIKTLGKFKGLPLESIGFNKKEANNKDSNSTGPILFGTANGDIYEAEVVSSQEYFKKEDRYIKKIYSIPGSSISGIKFELFPTSKTKYFIMVAAGSSLYQFVGESTLPNVNESQQGIFDSVFSVYRKETEEKVRPYCNDLPGDCIFNDLVFFSKYQNLHYQSLPKMFACLSGSGVYFGTFTFGSQKPGESIVDTTQVIGYPQSSDPFDPPTLPLSLAMTEFHSVLLYSTHIKAISLLTGELIYEETIPIGKNEGVGSLVFDSSKSTYWLFTYGNIYELVIHDEDRHVWEFYLKREMFEQAMEYAKTPDHKNIIVKARADYYYSQNRFLLSASYYADSNIPFEEVVLKFLDKNEKEALKEYISRVMKKLDKTEQSVQISMLSTWLVNIKLEQIVGSTNEKLGQNGAKLLEKDLITDELKEILAQFKNFLDVNTIYQLMTNYGLDEELLYFAELVGDYEKVICYWCEVENYINALNSLKKQASLDLYYRYSTLFMENIPVETVDSWIQAPSLNPRNLIPSLLKYKPERNPEGITQNQAIRYLHYVIDKLGNRDPVVHNYLLTLYTEQPSEENLIQFIVNSVQSEMPIDLDYGLRLCYQKGKKLATIRIYSFLGLYKEAVEMSLINNDIELARINADKPAFDDDSRKKLWLKIARHIVEEEKDIKKAMSVLRNCELLKIEDILPFFPDFVVINDFKEELCSALQDYNRHIEGLKQEMFEASKSADAIRNDTQLLNDRHITVSSQSLCNVCHIPATVKPFFVFPCQHFFHSDCLISETVRSVPPSQALRIKELQQLIQHSSSYSRSDAISPYFRRLLNMESNGSMTYHELDKGGQVSPSNTVQASGRLSSPSVASVNADPNDQGSVHSENVDVVIPQIQKFKEELEDIIASECILCGDIMIDSIEKEFIDPVLEAAIVQDWTIV